MKILFLANTLFDSIGQMYLTAFLKKGGHQCKILIECEHRDFISDILREKPDVAAFSVTTGNHLWAINLGKTLKRMKHGLKVVFGGPHCTFYPQSISHPDVDAICIGEGEIAFLELVNRWQSGEKPTDIANFCFKENGNIYRNDVRNYIENLDVLPFPDREYYTRYKFLHDYPSKPIMAGRGCPYKCTFCFNDGMNRLYKGKGKTVRYRSVRNIIEEIEHLKKNYPLKTVVFMDDTFAMNKPWLEEFLENYKKNNLPPFWCQLRVNLVTEDLVKNLSEAGCRRVSLGIESGNEYIREKILHKGITNEKIIETGNLLRKYKMKFRTYNMFGLPEETLDRAFETVLINQKIKTDYPWAAIAQPFPGTELFTYMQANGMIKGDVDIDKINTSFFKESIVQDKEIGKLVNLQKLFYLVVKFPVLNKTVKTLVHYNWLRFLYEAVFKVTYIINSAGSYNTSIFRTLVHAFKMNKMYNRPKISEEDTKSTL